MNQIIQDFSESVQKEANEKRLNDILRVIAKAELAGKIKLPAFIVKIVCKEGDKVEGGYNTTPYYDTTKYVYRYTNYSYTEIGEITTEDVDKLEHTISVLCKDPEPWKEMKENILYTKTYTKTIKNIMVVFTVLYIISVIIILILSLSNL